MKSMYYLANRMELFQSVAQQRNQNTAVEKSGTISREEWKGIYFPVDDLNVSNSANVF